MRILSISISILLLLISSSVYAATRESAVTAQESCQLKSSTTSGKRTAANNAIMSGVPYGQNTYSWLVYTEEVLDYHREWMSDQQETNVFNYLVTAWDEYWTFQSWSYEADWRHDEGDDNMNAGDYDLYMGDQNYWPFNLILYQSAIDKYSTAQDYYDGAGTNWDLAKTHGDLCADAFNAAWTILGPFYEEHGYNP